MFAEHEMVKLKYDVPARNLKAGTLGAVVMVYPEAPQAYEVEFIDCDGNTLALFTVGEDGLALVSSGGLNQDQSLENALEKTPSVASTINRFGVMKSTDFDG